MPKFKDTHGREWEVELTVGTITAAKRAGIPLDEALTAEDNKPLQELVYGRKSLIPFVNLLFLMVERQAKERAVSDEDFGRSLDFAALAEARKAVVEAITFFTHPPQTAAEIQTALRQALETADLAAAGRVRDRTPELLEKVRAAAVELSESPTSNGTSGSSPASPASPTPAP